MTYSDFSTLKCTVVGLPGAGKELVSKRIADMYGLTRICTGEICREIAEENTPLGIEVYHLIYDLGQLVPDDMMRRIFEQKVNGLKGYIADGYPRTRQQLRDLLEFSSLDVAIYLRITRETSIKRRLNRRICKNCGLTYNLAHPSLRPLRDNLCDVCNEP